MLQFADIEPYPDELVPAAIERVAASPFFPRLIHTLNPKLDVNTFLPIFKSITTTDQLQHLIMLPLLSQLAEKTMSQFTSSGFELLNKNEHYLFVSNHRDIFLDAAMLDIVLMQKGMDTPEVGFGSNLIRNDFVKDIFRLNKLFTIVRGGGTREFYENSLLHSNYIRHARATKNHSVWIAQRNGRTKDGCDKTEPALLKMFSMSGTGEFVEDFDMLRIVPVAVSYEYEPCDSAKVFEKYISATGVYEKRPNEDLQSIMMGLLQRKGNVHFTICPPIRKEELEECATYDRKERYNALAKVIDRRIYEGYHLHATNYIAHDLLNASDEYEAHYSTAEMEEFIDHISSCVDKWPSIGAREALRDMMLQMYANPVVNKINAKNN